MTLLPPATSGLLRICYWVFTPSG